MKKGYKKGHNENVIKFKSDNVGVYASRLTLALKDANRLDYETVEI